jgi:hypothetical protein
MFGKILTASLLILVVSAMAFAQVGGVQVLVQSSDGAAVAGAMVTLNAQRGGQHGGPHGFFHGLTDEQGTIAFDSVRVGAFAVTAAARMQGFAAAQIDVVADQITNVTLTLTVPDDSGRGGHHGGGHGEGGEHRGDSLTVVDLTGTAIVEAPDSTHRATRYYLDVDGDGTADYRLSFGPEWYVPASGAVRPLNGDAITINGGLFSYSTPPTVIVYQLNGLVWRTPGRGHGGYDGEHGNGCNPDSVVRVELTGTAIVHRMPGHDSTRFTYAINTDDDMMADYILNFGPLTYDPGNGATRPVDGDTITIVGGQIICQNIETPRVIVYEINGMFWRQPGDTSTAGLMNASSVDPVYVGTAVSYLTAHNYPNPFNPTTMISYSVPVAGSVKLAVYDITGREVAQLVNMNQSAGNYAVSFDGSSLSSGIYFYRVTAGNLSFTNRMVLLK